ncbi:Permease of the drug/metabolite transporter (DMT) superfamily [Granulicella pectinivorans]|jgi:drug/metabolite transporter (DMT)-like permease|uniref:Permease of the drug/metabolite transporter (DMT) superfamily n=1 Tax=Granulicella pectinivorans TaxID=474950 RepID=A0A1I6MJ81_9BACT|nr:EamA family transporter [Granulicella pectinivorans]SFS15765.1 Permease of the drug/metabolite transporter (DMT) superfamily [Granulicella pectinivorans]
MDPKSQTPRWQILLAFGIIYFVWGSTFLAIRVGVHEVPPFLFAALRFLAAGAVLFGWMRARGEAIPTPRQWASVCLMAILIFVCDYGFLFWAERRIPSGIAAVMMATIPAFMSLSEIAILRTQRLTARLIVALVIGLAGVAVLMLPSLHLGDAPIDRPGALACLFGAVCWSVASALSRKLPLPPSKPMNSGAQMLVGGIFLTITAALLGELRGFHPTAVSTHAWLALLYLIVPGSIIGFTAYVWLLHHFSPTKVGTYAYVNPVVAVILGYFAGGEALGPRTILGTICVLASVLVITTAPAPRSGRERRTKPALS